MARPLRLAFKGLSRLALAGLLAFGGAAPAVAGAGDADLPGLRLPARFDRDAPSTPPAPLSGGWWRRFDDPALDALIARMHAGNTGIKQAAARLSAARAAVRAGVASQAPSIGAEGSASHAGGPLVNAAGESGDLFTTRAAAAWEVDLFGRLSGERAAERQDAEAAEALLRDATLLMEAETARSYFAARHYAAAAAEASRSAELEKEALAIAERRRQQGLIAPDRLFAGRVRADAARERADTLAFRRDGALRQLGLLLGETAALPIGGAAEGEDREPPLVPVGLPAELLGRRPDLIAARHRLTAADDRLRAARQSWLPALTLTASGGSAAAGLGQLFGSAAGSFGLGALLSLPIFDGGRRKARIAGRGSERDLAEAQYRERVLVALREVNDGLQRLQVRRDALASARREAADGETSLGSARQRAGNGTISRLDLIAAEVAASERRAALEEASGRSLIAAVDLFQALGGNW